MYFTSRGDSTDQEYFYVSPTTGAITLRKSLLDSVRNQFSFTVQALDNRPQGVQRVAEASVTINILRDSGPPRFVNTPYITSIPITTAINSSVYRVQAIDSDLKVGHIFCNSNLRLCLVDKSVVQMWMKDNPFIEYVNLKTFLSLLFVTIFSFLVEFTKLIIKLQNIIT